MFCVETPKEIRLFILLISFKQVIKLSITKKENKKTSLILLKKKALKLDLTVPRLVLQKLIRKKDDNPIDSQPKNSVNKLLLKTSIIMLKINQFINNVKRSSCASYFK